MFYDVVVNDWGETTYVPTTLGNICLVILILALLGISMFFIRKNSHKSNRKLTIKQLAFCAVSIALGTVLSSIKVFSFPTGGSITLLSMLIICLPGYWFGPGAGIMTGIAYGVLQMLVDPYILYPMQLVIDYLLAFGALGLAGLFAKRKNGLIFGYLTGVSGRFIFSVLSGWIFFGMYAWENWNPLLYSIVYNAIYIFSEAAVTIAILLLPPVKKAMEIVKKEAVG